MPRDLIPVDLFIRHQFRPRDRWTVEREAWEELQPATLRDPQGRYKPASPRPWDDQPELDLKRL